MLLNMPVITSYNIIQRQIFRIGTVRYAEGLWRMRRHGPVIAHCTDSEDFPVQQLITQSVKAMTEMPSVVCHR